MTKLIVVRHGETEWNSSRVFQGHQNTELSEVGIRQAERLAKRLAEEKIDAAYASDLKRAYRTATIALKSHQIAVAPDSRLRELAFGYFEGLNNEQIIARYPQEWNAWNSDWANVAPPGGGETLKQLAARVGDCFEQIKRDHPDQTVLLAAHAGPIRALLCLVLHVDLKHFWQHRVDNASLTLIETYGDHAVVALLNDTCHLKDA